MSRFGKQAVDWQQRVDFTRLREERLAKAHKMLNKYGLGAAMVFSWDSKRYLSNAWNHPYEKHIPSHFVLLVRDAGYPYVSVRKGFDDQQTIDDAPWLGEKIVTEEVLAQPSILIFRPDADTRELWKKTAEQIKSLMKKHGVDGLPVAIDYANPLMVSTLQEAGIKIVDGVNWILEASMVKTDDEVELMKLAATCNEAGYAELVNEFRSGMRECDAQAIMAKGIYRAGADYYEGWVVNSGPRTSPRNFNWSDRTVRPGELMSMECCHVNFCGYKVCYDRTFLVGGKPTEVQSELYQTTVELHYKVQDLLKPGITTHDVARSRPHPPEGFKSLAALKKYHSEFKSTGFTNHFGGMGIRWYDAPVCTLDAPDIPLEKNMMIAYHGIYWVIGGEGVAIENTYRITDTGCELMCKWPYEDLIVLGKM